MNITWISQISFRVLETEALLNLKYKTIRETNCLREHSLSDLLLLCLSKLYWSWLFSFGMNLACVEISRKLFRMADAITSDALVNWDSQLTWRNLPCYMNLTWYTYDKSKVQSVHKRKQQHLFLQTQSHLRDMFRSYFWMYAFVAHGSKYIHAGQNGVHLKLHLRLQNKAIISNKIGWSTSNTVI